MPEFNENDLLKGFNPDDLMQGVAPAETSGVGDVQTLEQLDMTGEVGKPSLDMKIAEAKEAAMRGDNPFLSALAPRVVGRIGREDKGFTGDLGAAAGDVFSLPGRLIAATGEFEGNTFEERFKNYLKSGAQKHGEGWADEILRNPVTGAAIALAPFLGPLAASGTRGALTAGAIEGAGTALIDQMERLGEGEELSPGAAIADIGISLAMPGFGPMFKRAADPMKNMILKSMEKVVEPSFARLSSQLAGVSTEALEIASTKKGRQKLIAMSGKASEVGDDLLTMLDNIDENYRYEAQLKTALSEMPDMSVANVKQSLNESLIGFKNGLQTGPKVAAAEAIEKQIKMFDEFSGKFGGSVPASQFRNMRKDLDFSINFDKEGADLINSALKRARKVVKEDLIVAGKGTPYEETMDNYFSAIKARDDFYKIAGKRSDSRGRRIEGIMNNMFSGNKAADQKTLAILDRVFGSDFTKDAKLVSLSKSIVKDGKIPLIPMHFTGKSMLGPGAAYAAKDLPYAAVPMAGLALTASSPKLASLAMQGMKEAGPAVGKTMGLAGDIMSNPLLQRTIPGMARVPIQQGLAGE